MSTEDKPTTGIPSCAITSDRRAAARFASIREASCSPLAERHTVLPVRVKDVSANGIGLVSERRFERGTILLLQIRDESQACSPLLVGKVVHVTAQADGHWHIGCALTRALAHADVLALTIKESEADQKATL
jgi:hypothetical protein